MPGAPSPPVGALRAARASPRARASRLAHALGFVALAVMLNGCMLRAHQADSFADHRTDTLVEVKGHYRLNRAFQDYYDTAFVLTRGTAAPRVATLDATAADLSHYDVVFFGEIHGHAGVHLQQMALFRALYARDPHWILSLEQFERDVQGVVDDYLAGRIGETTLVEKGRAWNNYAASYRPMLTFAKEHRLPVIAAEAPEWAVECVGQRGPEILSEFTPEERTWVARDLHLSPGPYRDKFMQFQGSSPTHGGGTARTPEAELAAQRSFAAQVARDDTMAESIERALRQHPGYKVLHLTGTFHSAGFLGTVERLRLRDPALKIAVIDPIEVADPEAPSFDADELRQGTVLQLVYPNPEEFVEGEDMSAFIAKMKGKRLANACKYTLADAPG
jgi:uncharacterized iron-regulated protein